MIYRNLLMTRGDGEPGKGNTVKAFDIVTGQHRWTFYFKAQPGDPNRETTWLNGSADAEVSPGMWGQFIVDEARGLIFVPIEKVEGNGNNDYWGGGSHGDNLYSDSLVALDGMTGRMKWFQQLMHHDIWDYDIAAAPVLIDVRRNGQVIPAVAQTTKMALMFIFNRETGEPIFGMEDRPVPQTNVPGEWTSPTQPFPIKPEPLARNSFTRAELAKVTPEHQAFCENLWDSNGLKDTVPYQPVEGRREHRRLPRSAGRQQLVGRHVQQVARPHHRQRSQRGAVGPSRARTLDRTARSRAIARFQAPSTGSGTSRRTGAAPRRHGVSSSR